MAELLFPPGLKISEDVIRKVLNIPTVQTLIQREVSVSKRLLDVFREAPYIQAQKHLEDGEIEKSKDKVIEAMSVNELDLRARILYIYLLSFEGKYGRVLEECLELLEMYGFREELIPPIPPSLFKKYVKYYTNSKIKLVPFEKWWIWDYNLKEIWCSFGGIVTKWKSFPNYVIKAFSWEGKDLFEVKEKEIKIVTSRYAILGSSRGPYDVYRLSSGFHLPIELSPEAFTALFSQSDKYKDLIDSSYTLFDEFTFKNVTIKQEKSAPSGFYTTPTRKLNVSFCESLNEE